MAERVTPVEHPCGNHPARLTGQVCLDCGRPFCEDCLAEFVGRRLCGWCRDQRLRQMQPSKTVDAAQVLTWARIYDGCMALGGSVFSLFCGGYFSLPFWLSS